MTGQSLDAAGRPILAGVAAMALTALAGAPASAAETAWPRSVSTTYRLYFNGFEVGAFAFRSESKGKTYKAESNAKVSALFGAFKWNGNISATGKLEPDGPQPSSYAMNFKTKSKEGRIRLGFDKAGVKSVTVEPKKDWVSPEIVPIKDEHKKSVFDPMSAILAMTHEGGGDPCAKTVPIFDGKVRFNLIMSYKGKRKLEEKTPSGQPKDLVVCKVKYQPLPATSPRTSSSPGWITMASRSHCDPFRRQTSTCLTTSRFPRPSALPSWQPNASISRQRANR